MLEIKPKEIHFKREGALDAIARLVACDDQVYPMTRKGTEWLTILNRLLP